MGSNFSSSITTSPPCIPLTATVIGLDGSLTEYSQAIKVSHILTHNNNNNNTFLCNADQLFYGHNIQPLDDNYFIELGKLYFVLPIKRLNYPLSATEMAAMAARANSAFVEETLIGRKSGNCGRVLGPVESEECERFNEFSVGSWKTERFGRGRNEVKERVLGRGFRAILGSIEEV